MVAPKRILVIDDDETVRRSCQRALSGHGYDVEAIATGREGLHRACQRDIDLVMADLRLPDLDGMEVVRALRIRRPEVVIVIITGYGTVGSAVEAIRLGVSEYIEKPFTPDQIMGAINRSLTAVEGGARLGLEAGLAREVLGVAAEDRRFGERLLGRLGGVLSRSLRAAVVEICARYGNDRTRMMDIVREVQDRFGCVCGEAMRLIAREVRTHRVEVESVVSFYAFLSEKPKGKVVIRLCDDAINHMFGADGVAEALSEALGIRVGETTADGKFTLEHSPCMGMCDQAPAVLINDVVVTHLTRGSAREIAGELQHHMDPRRLVKRLGDGNNAHELIEAMVANNIRRTGPVIFADLAPGEALTEALAMTPTQVIGNLEAAHLRGRGGAGFPTGRKWEFTRAAEGSERFVICNADEGEPGTFKDRVILTERADLMFEGMTIGGYAVGAETGILYLRGEYAYLRRYLERVLHDRRNKGLLGSNVCGKEGFDFDIRIQMGAGSYVCGEETALISSCEGLRGDPKSRPPFPAQKGYLASPTVINNVETFCCVARILQRGPDWFARIGSKASSGTKLLSISGDCARPGVYELPFGIGLREVLELAGAKDAIAVQVGGPSGQMLAPDDFDRIICYDDLATGGSIMIFGPGRNVLTVAANFMQFFVDEGCGHCTPCRAGNVLLKQRLEDIISGRGTSDDLRYLEELGETIGLTSRCGLGQTSANPVLTTLRNFRSAYESMVKEPEEGKRRTFDIRAALGDAEAVTGRRSVMFAQS